MHPEPREKSAHGSTPQCAHSNCLPAPHSPHPQSGLAQIDQREHLFVFVAETLLIQIPFASYLPQTFSWLGVDVLRLAYRVEEGHSTYSRLCKSKKEAFIVILGGYLLLQESLIHPA